MDEHPKPTFLDKLSAILSRKPENRLELLDVLRSAYERHLIEDDALFIIEGALQVSDITVEEIMVPRSQVFMIDINTPIDDILPDLVENAHSRFPVHDGNRDNVIGILLAKDLLKILIDKKTQIKELLRPAVFVPESKRLNVLLKDFRTNRNHMAVIVDEYGGVAGIVTIEDVLEQIVGEIEDEHDYDDGAEDLVVRYPDNRYRVDTRIEIEEFNRVFGCHFPEDMADTLGGFLIQKFGRLPDRGEIIDIQNLSFEVVRSDPRRLYTVMVEKKQRADEVAGG